MRDRQNAFRAISVRDRAYNDPQAGIAARAHPRTDRETSAGHRSRCGRSRRKPAVHAFWQTGRQSAPRSDTTDSHHCRSDRGFCHCLQQAAPSALLHRQSGSAPRSLEHGVEKHRKSRRLPAPSHRRGIRAERTKPEVTRSRSLYLSYETERRPVSHSYGMAGTSWRSDQ
jgi:hypothetical protein